MRTWTLLIVLLTVMLAAGVTPVAAAPTGQLVIGADTDTPTMDAHGHSERIGHIINWHLYDSLFYRQADTTNVPALAESYRVVNGTTVDLKLRRGVRFHNGEPFTAEAVKFSLERILDPATKSPRTTAVGWLKSVEVLGEHEARLHFKAPSPLWLIELTNLGMMPPKYAKEKGIQHFSQNPVGTGPYKFVRWTRGQEIVLEANTEYWKGAPGIKTLVFKIIPDPSTRVAALLSGAIDLLGHVAPEDVPVLQANTSLKVQSTPILRFQWTYLSDAMTKGSPLADKRVRQAVNHAVNTPRIIKDILGGYGTPTVALNPLHFGYNPNVKPYPYDPAKAKALLKEAGYANGFETTIHFATVNMMKGDEMYQAVQSDLAAVGIKAKLQKWSGVGYMDMVRSGRAKPAYGLNWGSTGLFDGDAVLFPFFRSGQYYTFWSTPEVDALIDQQRTEMDPEKRKALMFKIQEIVREEAPWLFQYAFHALYAHSAKFAFTPRTDEFIYAYEIKPAR
jgi:peptide/nickel transport system substrate-binding protein